MNQLLRNVLLTDCRYSWCCEGHWQGSQAHGCRTARHASEQGWERHAGGRYRRRRHHPSITALALKSETDRSPSTWSSTKPGSARPAAEYSTCGATLNWLARPWRSSAAWNSRRVGRPESAITAPPPRSITSMQRAASACASCGVYMTSLATSCHRCGGGMR